MPKVVGLLKISHDMNAMDLHWVLKWSGTKHLMGCQWLAEDEMSVKKLKVIPSQLLDCRSCWSIYAESRTAGFVHIGNLVYDTREYFSLANITYISSHKE